MVAARIQEQAGAIAAGLRHAVLSQAALQQIRSVADTRQPGCGHSYLRSPEGYSPMTRTDETCRGGMTLCECSNDNGHHGVESFSCRACLLGVSCSAYTCFAVDAWRTVHSTLQSFSLPGNTKDECSCYQIRRD